MEAVVDYLHGVDPEAAAQARLRYGCFDHVQGRGARVRPCGRARPDGAVRGRGGGAADRPASARRRAAGAGRMGGPGRVLRRRAQRPARARRRAVLPGDVPRTDLVVEPPRPPHGRHRRRPGSAPVGAATVPAKIVVWAHNSHVGDATATELGAHGELTLGQLVRQRWADEALLVGFTTDTGTVTAASEWGGAGRAEAGASGDGGQLGVGVPRAAATTGSCCRSSTGPSWRRRGAARAGDRRDLPARDRTGQPLVPRPHGRAVRRGGPPGPHHRGGAAGADLAVGPAARLRRPIPAGSEPERRHRLAGGSACRCRRRPPSAPCRRGARRGSRRRPTASPTSGRRCLAEQVGDRAR